MTPSQRCFVIMGFGEKIDYYNNSRTLNLTKPYEALIKPVVEEKGLVCVRADEISHPGVIDLIIFRELLTADVVIADISTANPNVLYELGIRHAFRPRATILISEAELSFPFDLSHDYIKRYTLLQGTKIYDVIDVYEAERFKKELRKALDAVLHAPEIDSPVYIFLPQLQPPSLPPPSASKRPVRGRIVTSKQSVQRAGYKPARTLASLIEQGEEALRHDRFHEAKERFAAALQLYRGQTTGSPSTPDPYLVRRLVLATYKTKRPNELKALLKAKSLLKVLKPYRSNDPETAGLAGDIEKGLFDHGKGEEHLDFAIALYTRRHSQQREANGGLDLARALTVRADLLRIPAPQKAIADLVRANRIQEECLELSKRELAAIRRRKRQARGRPEEVIAAKAAQDREREFSCLAAIAEAWFGLGEIKKYERFGSEARDLHPPVRMLMAFEDKILTLRELLARTGSLLTPPWHGDSRLPSDSIDAGSEPIRIAERAAKEKQA